MSKVLVDRELLEYLADLGDEAIERMGSYLAEKHGEQRYVDAARAVLAQPAEAEVSLADRMRAAGMMTIEEMLAEAPLDRFIKHAGVNDLEKYGQWLDMKCREFLSMQASRELEKREDDDLYEWVLAHAAAFQEARINFKAARDAHLAALSTVTAERDRLRELAYVGEHMHDDYSWKARHAELRAELDELRKDAERYRWLRDQAPKARGEWEIDGQRYGMMLGADQDDVDQAVDALMSAMAAKEA